MKYIVLFYLFITIQNSFSQWESCNNGLNANYIRAFGIKGQSIFVTTSGNGVFCSTDQGNSWIEKNSGLKNVIALSIAINGENIFVGAAINGVFLSTDNGDSWIKKGLGYQYIQSLIFNENKLFAGIGLYVGDGLHGGIQVSSDNGNTWSSRPIGGEPYISSFASKNNIVVAGTNSVNYGVLLSNNYGDNWIVKNSGLTNSDVQCLAFCDTNILSGTLGGIFFSTNNGDVWVPKNQGLTNLKVHSIVVYLGNIFIGTENGVFLSMDNGNNWIQKSQGLTNNYVCSINILEDYIYAGTNGSGVFKAKISDLITNVEIQEQNHNSLFIYPNPATDEIIVSSSNIKFNKIEIINLIGNKIIETNNRDDVTKINIESLPVGVYLLRVGNETKIFVK